MELNEKIKALRTERGLSQKELAAAIGVSDKTVSKWECGRGGISLKVALELAEALGAHIDDLLPVGAVADKEFLPQKISMSMLSKIAFAFASALVAASLIWMAALTARAYDERMISGWLHAGFGVLIIAVVSIVFVVRFRPDSVIASGFCRTKEPRVRSVYNLRRAYALTGETVSLAACVFAAAQFSGVAFIAVSVNNAVSIYVRIAVLIGGLAGVIAFHYLKFAKILRDEKIIRKALDSGRLPE